MAPLARLSCAEAVDANMVESLNAGDSVEVTGRLLTLRDASARQLVAALDRGERPRVPLAGAIMYAVGPSPAKPGQVIGSAGPTTTARMERYLPSLLAAGVRGVIGKGELHGPVAEAFVRYRAVYLAATGGIGALLAQHITSAQVLAFAELGPEAIYRLDVIAFPAVVILDLAGRNFHDEARRQWRQS